MKKQIFGLWAAMWVLLDSIRAKLDTMTLDEFLGECKSTLDNLFIVIGFAFVGVMSWILLA
ncbi:MAG: hypothetical protein PUB20_01535 [Clostridia bacterium]|nr:hypothetical protein [Clostridia bacterium]